jgi:hypothetical protein
LRFPLIPKGSGDPTAPGAFSIPSPLDRTAFFEARYRSAAIWSFSGCCSTLPESPVAFFGPAALHQEA